MSWLLRGPACCRGHLPSTPAARCVVRVLAVVWFNVWGSDATRQISDEEADGDAITKDPGKVTKVTSGMLQGTSWTWGPGPSVPAAEASASFDRRGLGRGGWATDP